MRIYVKMVVREVVQKGNILDGKFSVTNSMETPCATQTSPEYVISGAAVFQVRFTVALVNSRSGMIFCNQIFVRFNKCQRPTDDQTYVMKLTSTELGIDNKCFTSDDGTWRLVHENKNFKIQFTFGMSVTMEVVTSPSYFATLYEDTELTDFELRGEDGSVQMHSAVLAAASPVLHRLMAGSWRETTQGFVSVPETSQTTLQHLKDYVYLHTLPASGLDNLLLLAAYYIIPELEQKCIDKLVYNVSGANAYEMIEFAVKHKMERLLLAVLECVQRGVVSVAAMREHLRPRLTHNKHNLSDTEVQRI